MAALAQDDQSTLELKRRLIQEFIDAEVRCDPRS